MILRVPDGPACFYTSAPDAALISMSTPAWVCPSYLSIISAPPGHAVFTPQPCRTIQRSRSRNRSRSFIDVRVGSHGVEHDFAFSHRPGQRRLLPASVAPAGPEDTRTPAARRYERGERAAGYSTGEVPLVLDILVPVVGDVTPAQRRKLASSKSCQELEARLLIDRYTGGSRPVHVQLRELLVTLRDAFGDGDCSSALKVVVGCPALLGMSPEELLFRLREMEKMAGVSKKHLLDLLVEFPSFCTLPPWGRDRVGYFLGQVGLTTKEVARMAKRRPEVLERSEHRRLIDFFSENLQDGKAGLRRLIRKRPGLLSLSLTGETLEKIEFFVEEMGLGKDQVAKIMCAHPQVLSLDLDSNIRPVVNWLGAPNPTTRKWVSVSSRPIQGACERAGDAATDEAVAATAGTGSGALPAEAEDKTFPLRMPTNVGGEWQWGLGLEPEERRQVVSKQGDVLWKSVQRNLAKTTVWFVQEVGVSWEDMRKLAARSPALLSLSVEHNLQPTLEFLVELGMDRAKLRQTIVNQPALLTLSLTGNLRPKAALFRTEVGASESDIGTLLNQCPRVLHASTEGRILPRIRAMREAGLNPTVVHLRAICNYTEEAYADWLARLRAHILADTSFEPGQRTSAATAADTDSPDDRDDARGAGSGIANGHVLTSFPHGTRRTYSGDRGVSSVRALSLVEMGISYAIRARPARAMVPPAAPGSKTANTVAEAGRAGDEPFSPGRAEAKALTRRVARDLDVLDLYCGTGGFSMNAAAGGARSVKGVDTRAWAVRACIQNGISNGLDARASFVRMKASQFVKEASSEGRAWDLIVVDPPSFLTKAARSRTRALNTYKRMAEDVSAVLKPGGMLMAVDGAGEELFDTTQDMIDVLASAALLKAGLSLTPLASGACSVSKAPAVERPGFATGLNRASRFGASGTEGYLNSSYREGRGRAEAIEQGEGVRWALLLCSEAPERVADAKVTP